MTSASAPGKIILFGEHAVVYGQPALAVPVNQVHADAEVSDIARAGIWIDAPDIGLHEELSRLAPDHPLAAVINSVFSALGVNSIAQGPVDKKQPVSERSGAQSKSGFKTPRPSTMGSSAVTLRSGTDILGIELKITSTIPLASGLGSGAAVSVAIIRALSAHLGKALTDEKVSALAYEVEKIHHGTPSGIDNTVVTYGKPIFFVPTPSALRASPPQAGEKKTKTGSLARNFSQGFLFSLLQNIYSCLLLEISIQLKYYDSRNPAHYPVQFFDHPISVGYFLFARPQTQFWRICLMGIIRIINPRIRPLSRDRLEAGTTLP